jgi:hypothetical protein
LVASQGAGAIAAADRALRMAADHGYAVPHRALEARGLARISQGDTGGLVDVKEALSALLDLGRGRDAAVTWLNYGWVLWQIEGPVVAYGELVTARDFAVRRSLVELEQQISCTVLQLQIEMGRPADTVAACRAQLDHPGPAFTTLRRIEVLSGLAVAEAEFGSGARVHAEEAYRLAVENGWPDLIAIAASPTATARAADGDQDGVLETLQRLAALTDLRNSLELHARLPSLVRAAVAAGHLDAGAALAELLDPVLPMREYSALTARALLAEARGDRADAAAAFARAAADWGAFGNQLEQAHALRGLHRTTGDPEALARAEQFFTARNIPS